MEQLGLKNDVVKLQQILGSKLYSSKYSFISEVCQNATDSMRKAGKHDQPFDLGVDEEGFFFVRDYGTSFEDKETIVKYLCTLLESSKSQVKDENENQEIGKYGIGKISSAAYNSEWFYKIYKNGKGIDLKVFEIENKGIFYEFTSDYYDTTEPDGVHYKIKMQEGINSFIQNLLPKIKYFQNIFFKFDLRWMDKDRELFMLNERFNVYRTDLFQYSTLVKDTNFMHICIDQYSYPINWDELNITPVPLPVGLRFNLDELDVNPTREALIMNDTYHEKVMTKVNQAVQWFLDKYNEQNPVTTHSDIGVYQDKWTKSETQVVKIADNVVDFTAIVSQFNLFSKLNKPELKGITRGDFVSFWEAISKINKYIFVPKAMINRRKLYRDPYTSFQRGNNFFLDTTFSIYKKDYFKSLSGGNGERYTFYQIPEVNFEMWTEPGDAPYGFKRIHYDRLFNIDKDEYNATIEYKEVMDNKIANFQKFLEMFKKSFFKNISDVAIEAPPKKKRTSVNAQTGEIKIKKARNVQKYSENNCTFADDVLTLETAYKTKKLTIYGSEDNRNALDSMYPFCKYKFDLIILTDKNLKIMDNMNLHNFVNINKILDNLSIVSSVVTAYHINKSLLEKYNDVVGKKEIIRTFISTKLAEDLDALERYNISYTHKSFMHSHRSECEGFMKELYNLFLENPVMFKADVKVILDRVLSEIEKVDFVVMFDDKITDKSRWRTYDVDDLQRQVNAIQDLCRYRGKKMDWQHYKPFILDEQQECEPATA